MNRRLIGKRRDVTQLRIHQVIMGASEGDAITQMALSLRGELRRKARSEIFALWRHGETMNRECRPLDEFPSPDDVDLLVYHSSIGWPEMSEFLAKRTEKIAINYHNITPAGIYVKHNAEFAEQLELGRRDLARLRDRVVVSCANSEFSARDLQSQGYSDVHVVPAGFEPYRLNEHHYDLSVLNTMAERHPNGYVVAVGQVLPHKRVEQLMETVHILNSTHWLNLGLVVCGFSRQLHYRAALERHRNRCAMVDTSFVGPVRDEELATYLRAARVYLSMSDHEGLCIPPVEAMALGVPVVIKGSAAVPETIGDGGLVLPPNAGPMMAAEAIAELMQNDRLRQGLIHRGQRRSDELASRSAAVQAAQLFVEAAA